MIMAGLGRYAAPLLLALFLAPLGHAGERAQSAEEICRRAGFNAAPVALRECIESLRSGDPMALRSHPRPREVDPLLRGMGEESRTTDEPEGENEASAHGDSP